MRVAVAAVVLAAGMVHPQAPGPVAFEVASVRRNISGDTETTARVPVAGTVSVINTTVKLLVLLAYEIPPAMERFLLVDHSNSPLLRGRAVVSALSPDTPRFDIQGKIPDGAPSGQQFVMLRTLMAERFKLRARKEMRPVPVYALRVDPGQLGAGLRPSTTDCIEYRRDRGKHPPVQEPRGADGQPSCSTPPFPKNGVMTLRNAGAITQLIRDLQGGLDRPIVDETRLSTTFTWVLSWESTPGSANGLGPATIFTALKEQLGLRLEPHTTPLEVLVIDSIETPTQN